MVEQKTLCWSSTCIVSMKEHTLKPTDCRKHGLPHQSVLYSNYLIWNFCNGRFWYNVWQQGLLLLFISGFKKYKFKMMRTKCDFQFVLSLRKISEIIIMIVMIITIMHWQCTVQFSHHFMLITLFVSHNSTGILYRADHQPVIKKNKKNPFLSPPPQGWQKIEEKKELSLKKKDDFFPCFYHGFLYPNNCLLGGILKSFLFFSLLTCKDSYPFFP